MNSQIERIQLQHPAQTLDTLSFCQSTPDSVRAWLSQQDTNNQSCFSHLHSALVEISQLRTSPVNRWELAELFRPKVYLLISRIFHECKCKDQQKDKCCSDQPYQLLMKLADCYKVIISQITTTSLQTTLNAYSASIHRCMTEFAQLLCQTTDRTSTRQIWQEMHQLFQLAIKHSATNYTLTDNTVVKTRQLTIIDVYKRALLLGKAEGFSFQERKLINKALCLWVPHTRLTSSGKGESHFFIDLFSDSGLQLTSPSEGKKGKRHLFLDVRVLINHLKKLQANDDQSKHSVLSAQLISLLLKAWEQPSRRTYQRYPNNNQCQVYLGFNAIYRTLSKEGKSSQTSIPMEPGNNKSEDNDIWASAYDAVPITENHLKVASDNIEFNPFTMQPRPSLKAIQARSVNSSASGYCLIIGSDSEKRATQGELIAIQEQNQSRWLLGRIKWRKQKQGKLVIGIELFSAEVALCEISPITKTTSAQYFIPAILVSSSPEKGSFPVILCDQLLLDGAKFLLQKKGEIKRGLITRVLQQQPELSVISFRLLEEHVLSL